MKSTFTAVLGLILSAFLPTAALAQDGQAAFDQAMRPILEQYLAITDTLASDKTDGVAASAAKIVELSATLDASDVEPAHQKHYEGIAKNVPASAKALSEAKDIAAMRKALADLSRPMVMWAEHQDAAPATGVFCPMVKAPWLQNGKTVRNPYYGSKMLGCGDFLFKAGEKEDSAKSREHHH